MTDGLYKFPRLYVDAPLDAALTLPDAQAHYLKNVLRARDGDSVRLFNGSGGEYLASIAFSGKHDVTATPQKQVRPQIPRTRRVHLFFAPIKKDRLDTLVDMAVQLDATDLHPVLTDRTEVREIKQDRLRAHIIEAAEQCERLDLPVLHPLTALDRALAVAACPLFAGLERSDAKPFDDTLIPTGDCGCIVGPVGGWTDRERDALAATPRVMPVSLGPNVLRCETAVAAFLTRLAAARP